MFCGFYYFYIANIMLILILCNTKYLIFLCSLHFFLLGGVRQKKPARVDTGMEHFSYLSETKPKLLT